MTALMATTALTAIAAAVDVGKEMIWRFVVVVVQ